MSIPRLPHFITVFFALFLAAPADGQSQLDGFIRDSEDRLPVPGVYAINGRSLENTLSNDNGFFSLKVLPGDTLVFSNLGFDYTYYYVPDSIPRHLVVVIDMKPKNYLLDEVSVYSYHLSTNRPKAMKIGEPMVPGPEDIRYPADPRTPDISAPVDLLYHYFGKRPRQLRELRRLEREDRYREKLRSGNNREILMDITGMSRNELEALAFACKFQQGSISSVNDYDLLISLLSCYRNWQREQENRRVLDDAEGGWNN